MGTAYDDRFEGSDGDNMFCGLEGKDSFIGRGGFDSINFADGSVRFIRVNLARSDGQIIDDGFSNTEFAVGIEEVIGTAFADAIFGNFADNRLVGGGEADTLRGNAGSDTFAYEALGDFGDTILDFISGTDKLEFDGAGIGLTTVFNFVADEASISNSNSAFFLSGRTLMLDLDGTGLQAAVAVLTIQTGGTIAAGDIFVV